MNKTLVLALVFIATSAGVHAKPVQVFILAGQSNMDGQANVKTIDFLVEDKERPEPVWHERLQTWR